MTWTVKENHIQTQSYNVFWLAVHPVGTPIGKTTNAIQPRYKGFDNLLDADAFRTHLRERGHWQGRTVKHIASDF